MRRIILAVALTVGAVSNTASSNAPLHLLQSPVSPAPLPSQIIPKAQFKCLVITAYKEARGQGEMGMALVVHTMIERAKQRERDRDFCKLARRSYDGFRELKSNERPWDRNPKVWALAVTATTNTLDGEYQFGHCEGATHFFNPKHAQPYWRKLLEPRCEYRNHIFFYEERSA